MSEMFFSRQVCNCFRVTSVPLVVMRASIYLCAGGALAQIIQEPHGFIEMKKGFADSEIQEDRLAAGAHLENSLTERLPDLREHEFGCAAHAAITGDAVSASQIAILGKNNLPHHWPVGLRRGRESIC